MRGSGNLEGKKNEDKKDGLDRDTLDWEQIKVVDDYIVHGE